jgi:hypothetical protein
LTLGWYVKNERQVGVFGGSSWLGISLWKIAAVRYSDAELAQLAAAGVIDEVAAELPPFSRPSEYVRYGFNATTENAEWARDDFNNINIPAISRVYQENSLRLIAHDPGQYLRMVFTSFFVFSNPASKFPDIAHNSVKIAHKVRFYSDILQLHYPFRLVKAVGSILVVALPVSLLLYGIMVVRYCGFSARCWLTLIRQDAPMLFAAFLIAYTLVVCCLLEFGENFRFKFAVEIPLWAFIATVHYRRYWRPR